MESLVTDEQVEEFHERGFVLGGRLLEDDDADEMNAIIDDIVDNSNNPLHERIHDFKHGGKPLLHIRNMWQQHAVFKQLHENPSVYRALCSLTGVTSFNLWHDRFFYKPARSGGYHTWHQDSTFLPFVEPYKAVGVWIALTDADEANGAMSMVPGSHRWGDAGIFLEGVADYVAQGLPLPDRYNDDRIEVELCPVPKGHVHFHDAATWHASGPNWSDRTRNAIGMFIVGSDTRFDGSNRWAKDYKAVDGETLDSDLYPRIDKSTGALVAES